MGGICGRETHSLTPRSTPGGNDFIYDGRQPKPEPKSEQIRYQPQNIELPKINYKQITPKSRKYNEVSGRSVSIRSSWLGNVTGTIDPKNPSFLRNHQYFVHLYKKSKLRFLLKQDTLNLNERRSAGIFVLQVPNNCEPITSLPSNYSLRKSAITLSHALLEIELEPLEYPYIVICSHTTTDQGQYQLAIDSEEEFTIAVPPNCIDWFDKPTQHKFVIEGEWKGPTSGGGLDSKTWLNSPQYPVFVTKPTKCTVVLSRKLDYSFTMGLLIIKSNNIEGRYRKETLLETDIVGRYINYTSDMRLSINVFLIPRKMPYIIVPLVGSQGREGKFDLTIHSHKPLEIQSDNNNQIEYIEEGIWIARSCGGNVGDVTFFFSPQFFIKVMKNIDVTVHLEQMVEFGKCINSSFCIIKGSSKITKENFSEADVVYTRTPSVSPSINATLSLKKGEYVIIPFPKTTSYGYDIPIQLRVCTTEQNAIQLEASAQNMENFDTESFKMYKVDGVWELMTSGGGPESVGFFNNPQYMLKTFAKSKIEIILQKTCEHWMPMAFFIVKSNKEGTRIGKETFENQQNVVGKVNFTSGMPQSVNGKYVLPAGNYAIIAASQIEGRQGDFTLKVKSDQKVELKEIVAVPQYKKMFRKGFIGGRCGARPSDKFFSENPTFALFISQTAHVFFDVSPSVTEKKMAEVPKGFSASFTLQKHEVMTEKRLNVIVYVFKPGQAMTPENLLVSTQLSNWKNVSCSAIFEPSPEPYRIVIGTNEGKEGEYTLTVASGTQFMIQEIANVVNYFDSSEFLEKQFSGDWKGLTSGGPPGTVFWKYNPSYTIVASDTTQVELTLEREESEVLPIGFCVLKAPELFNEKIHDDDYLAKVDNSMEVFATTVKCKLILEPKPEPYLIVLYTGSRGKGGKFNLSVRHDSPLQIFNYGKHSTVEKEIKASWSAGRKTGGPIDTQSFKNNPQWLLWPKEPIDIVFEIEQNLLQTSVEELDPAEAKLEKIRSLFGVEDEQIDKNETRFLNVCLYIIKPHAIVSSLKDIEAKITSDMVYAQSGWKFSANVSAAVSLEPSDVPYIIVPTTIGEGQANSFILKSYMSKSVELQPVEGTIFENFEITKEFETHTVSGAWRGISAAGSPYRNKSWLDNPIFLLNVKHEAKTQITLKRIDPSHELMGIIVAQPVGSNMLSPKLFENTVFVEAECGTESIMATQTYLKASQHPYFIIPFSSHKGIEGRFELTVESNQKVSLQPHESTVTPTELIEKGGWIGISSGEPGDVSFMQNPQYLLSVSLPQNIYIYLENPSRKRVAIYVIGTQEESKLSEELNNIKYVVTSSKFTNSSLLFCSINSSISLGHFLIIPTMESEEEAPYCLRIYGSESEGAQLQQFPSPNLYFSEVTAAEDFSKHLFYGEWQGTNCGGSPETSSDWIYNPCIDINLLQQTKLEITLHRDKRNVNVEKCFYVLSGAKKEILEDYSNVVCKTEYSVFASSVSRHLSLPRGQYTLVVCNKDVGKPSSFFLSILSSSSDIHFSLKDIIETSSITADKLPEERESDDVKLLLKNVQEVPAPKHACVLSVYGYEAFPILTGNSVSPLQDGCDKRKKEYFKTEKMGSLEATPVSFYEPHIAGAYMKKGRIIAISDTRTFSLDYIPQYDAVVMLQNFTAWLCGNQPSAKIYAFSAFKYCIPKEEWTSKGYTVTEFASISELVTALDKEAPHMMCLVLSGSEKLAANELKNIHSFVGQGGGLLVMANVNTLHEPSRKTIINFSANRLLSEVGIMFCEGKLKQTAEDVHTKYWWLESEKLKECVKDQAIKPQRDKSKLPRFLVKNSKHAFSHVASCLEKFLFWMDKRNGTVDPRHIYPYFNILCTACWNIPVTDRQVMPLLKERFSNPDLVISKDNVIKYSNFEARLAAGLNTNVWFSAPWRQTPDITYTNNYILPVPVSEKRISKNVKLGLHYQKWFSTGLYAPPGEIITIRVPPAMINCECRVRIGCNSDNLWWTKEKEFTRYPLVHNHQEIISSETSIANPFGGLIYVEIPSQVYNQHNLKEKYVHIEGAVECPIYVLGETSKEHWSVEKTKKVPFCEWISDAVIITLPRTYFSTVDDPSIALEFWRKGIYELEKGTGGKFPYVNRLCADIQTNAGLTHDKYPIVFNTSIASTVISPQDNINNKTALIFHELGHNLLLKQYVWKGRADPMANVFRAYVLDKLCGMKVDGSVYFVEHVGKVKAHLMSTEMSSTDKRIFYNTDPYLFSTMLELILVHEFGWDPYITLWREAHRQTTPQQLVDQEKLDKWVERFSELVNRDVSPYFDAWGLTISQHAKEELSRLQKWMLAL